MKKPRITLLFFSTMVLLASVLTAQTQQASAWLSLDCKFTTANLKWQDLTTRETYANAATNAVAAWYATSTPLVFTKVSSGTNIKLTDANLGAGGDVGVTVKYCSGGYNVAAPTSTLNRAITDAYSSTHKRGIFVHEIGHALGLADTSAKSCPNIEIMQYDTLDWDVCRYSAPRPGDIAGINALY